MTFNVLISSKSFSFISLYSSDSVFSWFRTLMASPSMASLSVFAGLPGSRVADNSVNLHQGENSSLFRNNLSCPSCNAVHYQNLPLSFRKTKLLPVVQFLSPHSLTASFIPSSTTLVTASPVNGATRPRDLVDFI